MNAASHLNMVGATTAPPLPINFWPDEAWDSEGNHWVQDQSGWHWHCRNQSCSEFTRKENWHEKFRDYEPEQDYGSAHDFKEHLRFGGTRDDY